MSSYNLDLQLHLHSAFPSTYLVPNTVLSVVFRASQGFGLGIGLLLRAEGTQRGRDSGFIHTRVKASCPAISEVTLTLKKPALRCLVDSPSPGDGPQVCPLFSTSSSVLKGNPCQALPLALSLPHGPGTPLSGSLTPLSEGLKVLAHSFSSLLL